MVVSFPAATLKQDWANKSELIKKQAQKPKNKIFLITEFYGKKDDEDN